ncbi:MAG: DUF637 domain-containing protein [Alphaproteobacteria bacterium]|nr:DUF637 domain-containing protein [Alphaproteobacteria bacterium]
MVNHKTGTFMLHDNQGIWDDAAFEDLGTDKVTFVQGLTLNHLTNKGTFQLWDGVYDISDIHNTKDGVFIRGHQDHASGKLQYTSFTNEGTRKAPNGLRLKNEFSFGKLESDKPLTLLYSKGYNAADALRNDQIQAPSLKVHAHTLTGQNVEGKGDMTVKNLTATTLKISAQSALTTETCHVDTVENAGTLKVQDSLTYTKTFKNKETAKADVKGLSFKPVKAIATPLTHDLENEGQLDLHQVNQSYAPKRMVNHKTGTFMLHDNQGIWDDAAFADLETDKVTFVKGLTLDHLTNKGTFQFWDGVYEISDIHNTESGIFTYSGPTQKLGHLHHKAFKNDGVRKAPNGLRLKNAKAIGRMESDKPLTLLFSKGVNAADALRNHQIQAPSLEIKGDMFHNPRGVDLKLSFDKTDAAGLTQTVLMPLQLDVKSFTNGGRMIAGSLGLTAHTFKQTDMAMITTLGDITMTVQGEVNNKVGQIQSRGKTYIRSINGDILVGDRGVREGYVYKRNGAFIEGGTHLILQAGKAINAGFGQLFLTGQRLDQATFDDQPLVHLKANQILLEAALIYATGSIYFETPRFSSHLSPWARHNDYLANVHHSNWYNGDHWAYTEKISCQIPEIISGADIIFDSASALLQATRVAARGNIVKKTEDQIAPCSTTNPQGLNLQDVTYYFYGWRGGRAGEPLGKELKGRYPTTLLSGTDINIEDRGFRATGLVGLFGANVRLIIGDQLSIHGAQGTLFPMAVEHTAHPKGVLTNLSGAAQRLQSARFMPTSDAQKLLQQKPASGAVITASLPLVQVQNSSSPVLTVNLPQNQVPFLLSGSYFVGESIDKNALTFLGLKGELLEIPAPGQLAQAKVSALTLEEARELPMLLSMRDWEMCYDLAHSGALFSTFSHHTLRETMARANHYAHNRGMLDVSDWQQMTEPCSAFAIVHYGGVRYLSLESYTPASYYQDHMRIHKAAIVAMNGDVNIVSRNAYIEQTHIMAIKDRQKALPDRALNQVEMLEDAPFQDTPAQKTLSTDHATRNTADETPASQGGNIRIMAKETLFTRDMDTTADKNTIMFGQQFAAVFGGEHQARKFYTASQGPVMVGGSEYCREIHIDTKNYKFHEIDRRFLPAIIRATQARFESFGAHDITFVGTHIYAPSQVITRGGKVHFKVGTDTYYSYRFEDDSDAFMTDISTSTHHRVTHHYPKITAPMQIEGAEQVLIDRIQKANGSISGGGFFTQMAQALSDQLQEKQASMPPFMDLLKGIDPDILEFTLAREVDRYTSENISGPGPAVMGIVAVAAAVLTYGAGASAFSAAGLTLESTSAIAAANAGFSALASQAAVSTLQNEGDIGKVLKDLASTRTVKNVAIAAVTGGLCDAALSAMGISEAAAGATEVVEAAAGSSAASSGVSASTLSAQTLHQSMQLTKEMMDMARYAAEAVAQQAISASVSHALGERGGFKNFAQVAFAQALMRYGLGKVDGLNLDDLSEKIAHTATGAAFGGILGGEKGAISGAMGALIANTVTNQACDLGLAPDTARKMGAIASALPAFWDDYNLHIGSSAGQASAGAAAQSQSRKLAEKIEQDKQAGDLKRLEEALLEKARIEAEQALKAKEGHADEKQKAASQNGSSSLQKKTKPLTPADKANLVSVLTAAPSLQAEEPLQNPHLLGNLHQQETVIHTDQARREAVAEHLVQGFKDIERGRVHGGHRRSLSGDICLIRASAHLGAQQTWNVLAEQEAQQFANMGYFNGMVNFRGGGSDMPAVPMVLPEPVYNTEAARKAFRTGLMDGHTTVGDSGKHLIDMAVPGGIDYGLAYAKGEITKSQLVAAQSAAIAGELAAGYVAGKVVKGVAKGAERVARFASELKTGKTLRARSVPVISYHGLEETILDGANPKNRFLHENQKIIYRRDMQRPYARDPKLRENLEELHRDSGIVGSGSTAAALREEIRTGTKVGGKDHYQKAEDGITYLKKWLTNNPTAYSGDRAAAENVLKDLLDAVKGVKQ